MQAGECVWASCFSGIVWLLRLPIRLYVDCLSLSAVWVVVAVIWTILV